MSLVQLSFAVIGRQLYSRFQVVTSSTKNCTGSSMKRRALVDFLDVELDLTGFEDSSLNGLQFEGKEEVAKPGVAVDAGFSVVKTALANGVDFLIVHHGLMWGKSEAIRGPIRDLYRAILDAELNLYAAHLPLDAHPLYGNNFGLARLVGLEILQPACREGNRSLGCIGENQGRADREELEARLATLPGAKILTLPFGPSIPERVCIVSGAGASVATRYAEEGFDTLITGEPRQFCYHFAKEHRLNIICAGHYATETVGVRLLGEALTGRFHFGYQFIDEPTGI